jgi:hypothetical protein
VLQILDSDGTTVLAESDDSNGSKDPYIAKFVLPMPSLPFSNPSFTSRLLVFYLSFTFRLPAPSDKPVTADLNLPSDLSVNTATFQITQTSP